MTPFFLDTLMPLCLHVAYCCKRRWILYANVLFAAANHFHGALTSYLQQEENATLLLSSRKQLDDERSNLEANPWKPRVWSACPVLGISASIDVLASKFRYPYYMIE